MCTIYMWFAKNGLNKEIAEALKKVEKLLLDGSKRERKYSSFIELVALEARVPQEKIRDLARFTKQYEEPPPRDNFFVFRKRQVSIADGWACYISHPDRPSKSERKKKVEVFQTHPVTA